jgi:hypothetical protein
MSFARAASHPCPEYLFSPTMLFPTVGNSHFWDAILAGSYFHHLNQNLSLLSACAGHKRDAQICR